MRILIVPFIFLTATAFGQGNVEIIKDSRIDALVRSEGAIPAGETAQQIVGYRVQLFFDSNKSAVDNARSRFVSSAGIRSASASRRT